MLSLQELRSSTLKELLNELKNARQELVKVNMRVRTNNTKDSSQLSRQKRYIAQIKTLIRELELEEMVNKAAEIE